MLVQGRFQAHLESTAATAWRGPKEHPLKKAVPIRRLRRRFCVHKKPA